MSALIEKLIPESLPDEPGEFGPLRRKALKVLMQHGFPHRKVENWKYTPLGLLESRAFENATGPSEAPWPELPALPFEASVLHLHDGLLDPARCRLPAGVTLEALAPADVDLSGMDDGSPADAFAWLNLARLQQGWRICVDDHARLERPLLLMLTCGEDFDRVAHPRLKLELGVGAEATLIEWQQGQGSGLINSVLDIELGASSRLLHLIDRHSEETALIERTTVNVNAESSYSGFILDGGGRLTRQDLNVNLNAANAHGAVCGVAVLDGRSLVDYHTAFEHRVGPSTSSEDFRILADDQSVGVFNGRIHILPGADDSHSEMNTGNMLLSRGARINTKPELEIHAEEVTASHGATIGQIDDEARFYLRSRGLSDAQAISLLKFGFAAAAFDSLEPGPPGQWLTDQLKERLSW
ncbi:MAG: SufD family Fe-S cluster assembly protein [Wenzhouxiangellaceae bacterium]|nr:SufD family Fe-S cluster assembly protein [Wenzhouxiangellaceae bacterium]